MYESLDDVRDAFKFHPPKDESITAAVTETRQECLQAATWIFTMVPNCTERDNAIDKLREAMMWANAGIARNQKNRG